MNSKLPHLQSASIFITYCCAYILFFADVMTIYHKNIYAPLYLLGIPLLLCVLKLFEIFCTRFPVYILQHFLLAVILFFVPMPDSLYRFLFYLLLAIETCRDYYLWMHGGYKPYRSIPWILITFTLLSYFCAVIYHNTTIMSLSYVVALVVMILHFLRLSLSGLNSQFMSPGNATRVPMKKIILSNLALVCLFILSFVLTSLFVHLFDLEYLLFDLGTLLKNVLAVILSFFLYVYTVLRALFARNSEAIEEEPDRNRDLLNALQAAGNPSLLSEILANIAKVAALIFLVYCIYRILSNTIKTYMTKHIQEADEVTNVDPKDTHIMKKKQRKLKSIPELLKADFVSQIRLAYRTKIRHYKGLKPKESETSSELEQRVSKQYSENIGDLTKVYQKARYSNIPLTKDDITKATTFSVNSQENK